MTEQIISIYVPRPFAQRAPVESLLGPKILATRNPIISPTHAASASIEKSLSCACRPGSMKNASRVPHTFHNQSCWGMFWGSRSIRQCLLSPTALQQLESGRINVPDRLFNEPLSRRRGRVVSLGYYDMLFLA